MRKPTHAIVVLGIPVPLPAKIAFAKAVSAAMAANKATFVKPTPDLAKVDADISAFEAAQTVVKQTKGTVAMRNDKLVAVEADLRGLRSCVQLVVDGSPEHAAAIAQSAGMRLRTPIARTKSALTVKPHTAGAVRATAPASAKPASHEWQVSYDAKTFTSAPSSPQASTTIAGLQSGVIVYIHHRIVTKDGPSEWSSVVSAVVP